MIAILEAMAIGIILMVVVHFLVATWLKSLRREELEKEWDAGSVPGDREDYIARGMAAYAHSLRRKVAVLVYILPTLAILATIYLVNRN